MMRPRGPDTSLGGRGKSFVSTRWSVVLSPGEAGNAAALTYLAQHYWKPVYRYIRVQRGGGNEEAKDLTQQFFLWIMESGFLGKVHREAGRFRAFLKTALANFMTDQHRTASRVKRGGGAKVLPLDLSEDAKIDPADERQKPEAVLDRGWKESVIDQAMRATQESFRAQGKKDWVDLWMEYDLSADAGRLGYTALAGKYGITKREVSYWLTIVRKRFQEAVAAVVAETVSDERALDAELRDLFG